MQFDFKSLYKSPTSIYWRYFPITFSKIDLCGLLGGWSNALPIVEQIKTLYLRIMPFIPRKCPIEPGEYSGYNLALPSLQELDARKISTQALPNGVYRGLFKFYNDEDTEGFMIRLELESYNAKNAENVM